MIAFDDAFREALARVKRQLQDLSDAFFHERWGGSRRDLERALDEFRRGTDYAAVTMSRALAVEKVLADDELGAGVVRRRPSIVRRGARRTAKTPWRRTRRAMHLEHAR